MNEEKKARVIPSKGGCVGGARDLEARADGGRNSETRSLPGASVARRFVASARRIVCSFGMTAFIAVSLTTGCDGGRSMQPVPKIENTAPPLRAEPFVVLPDGEKIRVEIADDDETRARGLMYRTSLDRDRGMLFVFENDARQSFWMKNTLIPLDILWLDANGRIVHVAENVPPCEGDPCPNYEPPEPARYVLELRGGEAARRRNLTEGATLQLPD